MHNSIETTKKIQPRGDKGPNLTFFSPIQEKHSPERLSRPVVTIDDLEVLAQQLLADIRLLKSYKYPLAVRRGVKRF